MSNHDVLAKVNQVEGFNPLDFARTIPSPIEGAPPSLYLDVKYRVTWFRLMYPQGKINKVITTLNDNMAVVECFIYKDINDPPEAYLANGFGQRSFDAASTYGSRFLECAETAAVGRALSAAGFNISVGADEDSEDTPIDSGIQMKNLVSPETPQVQSGQMQQPDNAHQPIPPTNNTPSTSSPNTQNMSVDEILRLITVDDAKKVVIPFNGKNRGKSLAQVAVEDPKTLEWIATNYSGPNNQLRAAAKKLLDTGALLAAA